MIKLKSKLKLLNLCLLTSLATTSFATAKEHILVVPQCLLNKVTLQYNTLAKKNDFALIQANQNVLNKLITAKSIYKKNCGGFLNVTDEFNSQKSLIATKHSYGNFLNQFISQPSKSIKQDQYKIRFKQQVLATTNLYAESQALSDLTKFTQFEDRYADSDTGVAAAEWLQKQIKDIATQYNRDDIEITIIATNTYKQPSVVVKIGKDNNNPGVVIGGHLDTLEKGCDWQGYCGNRPGADDDGSGSITTLETARALIASGIQFKKPIYIMWYAAEEEGLIGSQKVVAAFKKAKIAIDAVLQFDMTG